MEFILRWIIFYIGIMFAMFTDNYFWIPADYKWFGTGEWRPHFKVLFINKLTKSNREYIIPITKKGWMIVGHRIKTVLTSQYDVIPGLITSFILSIFIQW